MKLLQFKFRHRHHTRLGLFITGMHTHHSCWTEQPANARRLRQSDISTLTSCIRFILGKSFLHVHHPKLNLKIIPLIYWISIKNIYSINFTLLIFKKFEGYFGSFSFHLVVGWQRLNTTIRCYRLMPKISLGVMVIGNPGYIYATNDYEYLLARFRFLLFDTAGVVNKEAVIHCCLWPILRLTL